MADARRGRFDVVLVWASDRIARSVKHFLEVLDELNRIGVEYVSFRENIDTGGPLGRALVVIIGAIAELERSLIVERVRAGMRRARLEGHTDRPERPSLALDLMEELRSALADRLVLTLINRRQVQGSGFTEQDGGGIQMDDATRKEVISAWQLRKQDEIEHPYLKEGIPIGLVPYTQALLLARYVRGGLDAYPAFFWR